MLAAIIILLAISTVPIVWLLFAWCRPEIVADLNNRLLRSMKLDSLGLWTAREVRFGSVIGIAAFVLFDILAVYFAFNGP